MIADLLSQSKISTDKEGILRSIFNLTIEIQSDSQDGFDVRAILSSGNAFREGWVAGYGYMQVPDTMGICILGYNMPRFKYKKGFHSRIVNTDYDYPEKFFLEEKYSNFFVELPKLPKLCNKADWGEELHELWDLCVVFLHKVSDYEKVVGMVRTDVAKALLDEARKASSQDAVIDDALADDAIEQYVSELVADGKMEGISQGITQGITQGISLGEIKYCFAKLKRTVQQIAVEFGISEDDVEAALKQLGLA